MAYFKRSSMSLRYTITVIFIQCISHILTSAVSESEAGEISDLTSPLSVRSAEICFDKTMKSPIDIIQPVEYREFKVNLAMNTLTRLEMRKQASNLIKIEASFGSVIYDQIEYAIKETYFRSPSEHKVNGQRLPLEMQMIGKSSVGSKVGLSVLFTPGPDVNYFLNEMNFGKGYLKLLPVSLENNSKVYTVDTRVTFQTLFSNHDSWIMYEGSDTNVPCDDITWLISYNVVQIHPEQLDDFPTNSYPFFSTKAIGDRTIYRNRKNEEELLDDIKRQEAENNSKMKQQNQDDIAKEKARLTQQLADAIENIEKAETKAIIEAKQKIAEAKKKEQEAAVKKIIQERAAVKKKVEEENAKQKEVDKQFPTTLLYERIMDKIKNFGSVRKECPDYQIYNPQQDKPWGWVPSGQIMTWELGKYIGVPNLTIAEPELPHPKEIGLVFKPFYFTVKPKCDHGPNPNRSLLLPVEGDDGNKTTSSSPVTTLAQIDLFEVGKTNFSDHITLIPVVIKTFDNVSAPEVPVNYYTMLNATEVPFSPNSTNHTSHNVSIVPVRIVRDFKQNLEEAKNLKDMKTQNVSNSPDERNGGYSTLQSAPKHIENPFDIPLPKKGELVRIWPPLKPEWQDGSMPVNVKFPWDPIKESEVVVNLVPPPSPDREFRWIVLFWVKGKYSIGSDAKVPWVPTFILARSDFKWERAKLPLEIPVPKNLTYGNDGRLPIEKLIPVFEPFEADKILNYTRMFNAPIGVNPEDTFIHPVSFRLHIDKILNYRNSLYVRALEEKYSQLPGLLNDLYIQRLEEETGILIEPDIEWRITQEEKQLQEMEEERKRGLQKLIDLQNSGPKVIWWERVCLDYNVEVVLNHRTLGDLHGIRPKALKYCSKWGWKAHYGEDDDRNDTKNGSNGTNGSNNSTNPDDDKNRTKPDPIPDDEKERKCREYLKVVLNRRTLFSEKKINDYLDKECRSVFNKMREERLREFMGGFGPFIRIVKDTSRKSARIMKNAARDVKEKAESLNLKKNLKPIEYGVDEKDPRNLGPIRMLARPLP